MYSYEELEIRATYIAKEDGIYYEWLSGSVTDFEYECFINNIIESLKKGV